MHVAVFCHNYPPHPGGLEVVARTVAAGLARRHRVTLLTTAWREPPRVAEEDGLQVHRVAAWHGSEGWGVPYPLPRPRWLAPDVGRALAEMADADLFHAHGCLYATTLLAKRLARRGGKPLVVTEHVGWVPYRGALTRWAQRLAWATVGRAVLGRACHATAYNRRVVAWLASRRPRLPVTFLGNGVDSERFQPRPQQRAALRQGLGLPAGETLFLFAGRESEKKNLGALLALPRDSYRLVCCGAERRLPADVIDLGLVPYAAMADLFNAVDAMVHPSVGEGFPLAVQEAMAAGLPLVLLWDEGYRDVLAPEQVLACRGERDLGPALERLAATPGLRAELGRRGREWALGHWGWESTIAGYEKLLARLAAEGTQDA